MEIKDSRAYKYAAWCVKKGNEKAPKYVKLQAADWIRKVNGEDEEAYVDAAEYEKITKLLTLMQHPDLHTSLYDGLEDYAMFLIFAVFCTKERDTGLRYYETVLLEIARKNFKTFNSAVIFILLMLTQPKFSRFFSVAPDLKLSSELKIAIRKIIKSTPALDRKQTFEILRSEIRCGLTDSEYTPLAYSEDRLDGKLPNAWLADEAGAMDNYPIEAMRSGQITLAEPLGIIISTQYPNDDNGLIDEIDQSKKTLDGLFENKKRFSLLYEPDNQYLSGNQWQTEDNIIFQSNPAAVNNARIFGRIKSLRTSAVLYENKRENYLCKHNNIKYKGLGVLGYVEITKVRECRIERNDAFWRGKRVYIGLDLSQTDDNTSVAMATVEDGTLFARIMCFIPGGKIELKRDKEGVNYEKLIRAGCVTASDEGSELIDYAQVENYILTMQEKLGVEIMQVGYDRYNAISTVQKLEAGTMNENGEIVQPGLECVEIKQHSSVLHSPTKLLKEKILSGEFRYEENELLEINFENARCTKDTNLNMYVNKKKSAGKVDAVVALINATYLIEQQQLFGEENFVFQT